MSSRGLGFKSGEHKGSLQDANVVQTRSYDSESNFEIRRPGPRMFPLCGCSVIKRV